jgi:hypothetical protein
MEGPPGDYAREARLIRLARELAIEIRPTDAILAEYAVSNAEWEHLSRWPWFQQLLQTEMAQWQAAGSTHDRVRLKSAVLVEEWLIEANRRLHDKDESLNAKVELFKTLARIANLGTGDGEMAGGGFRVVINIAGSPAVSRQLNVPSRVAEDVEDVAMEREKAIIREAAIPQPQQMTRITIKPTTTPANQSGETPVSPRDVDPPRVPGRPIPADRPPRELSARALRGR